MSSATIAAIASPPGAGARGIVRISGTKARSIARAAWVGDPPEFAARALVTGRVHDGRGSQPVVCLWMPGPRSFTGEDVVELHAPGSPPLVAALFARVLELGATAARPGEFTRRAFENGRIDLTRAEGVLELVAARNDDEARAAGQLLVGGLGTRVDTLRDALDELRALCEASLDFDEADTGHVPVAELAASARAIRVGLGEALEFERARSRSTGLPRIALAGAPNAGKSTLFNALAGADAAIVSPLAGTTRDTLEAEIAFDGRRAVLFDTPGVDEGAVGVDRAAQVVAKERVASADLVLWVVDAAGEARDLEAERAELPARKAVVLAWAQVDRVGARSVPDDRALAVSAVVPVSAATGRGLSDLSRALSTALEVDEFGSEAGPVARELAQRHVGGLEAADAELELVLQVLDHSGPLDLAAEHLRRASAGLDEIHGGTTPEDLLDRIFARFCLGK